MIISTTGWFLEISRERFQIGRLVIYSKCNFWQQATRSFWLRSTQFSPQGAQLNKKQEPIVFNEKMVCLLLFGILLSDLGFYSFKSEKRTKLSLFFCFNYFSSGAYVKSSIQWSPEEDQTLDKKIMFIRLWWWEWNCDCQQL